MTELEKIDSDILELFAQLTRSLNEAKELYEIYCQPENALMQLDAAKLRLDKLIAEFEWCVDSGEPA